MRDYLSCVECEGVLELLGSLADKDWYRCQGCGIDISRSEADEPVVPDPATATFKFGSLVRDGETFEITLSALVEDADSWVLPVQVVSFIDGGVVQPVGEWGVHTRSLKSAVLVPGDFEVWCDNNIRKAADKTGWQGSGLARRAQDWARACLWKPRPTRREKMNPGTPRTLQYSAYGMIGKTVVAKKCTLPAFRRLLETYADHEIWLINPRPASQYSKTKRNKLVVRCLSEKAQEIVFHDPVALADALAADDREWAVDYYGPYDYSLEILPA